MVINRPPTTLSAARVLRTHGWLFTEERKCSAVAWVSLWLRGGGGVGGERPMAKRYSAQQVWIELMLNVVCFFFFFKSPFYCMNLLFPFDLFVLNLWFRVFHFKTKSHFFVLRKLLTFFLDFSVYFYLFLSEEGLYSMFFLCLQFTMAGDKHRIFTGVKGPFLWWKLFLFPQ